MDEPVQEVIDRSDNLEECLEELKGSGAKTCLPASVRNGDILQGCGRPFCVKGKAAAPHTAGSKIRRQHYDAKTGLLLWERGGAESQ